MDFDQSKLQAEAMSLAALLGTCSVTPLSPVRGPALFPLPGRLLPGASDRAALSFLALCSVGVKATALI